MKFEEFEEIQDPAYRFGLTDKSPYDPKFAYESGFNNGVKSAAKKPCKWESSNNTNSVGCERRVIIGELNYKYCPYCGGGITE